MFAPNYARKWSPIGDKLVSSRLHSKVGAAPVGNFAWRKRQRKSPQNGGAEISLMTQSNSLLGRKKFPVRACRELPRTILELLSYLAHFHSPRGPKSTKFPVFSQLAGNLGALPVGVWFKPVRRPSGTMRTRSARGSPTVAQDQSSSAELIR